MEGSHLLFISFSSYTSVSTKLFYTFTFNPGKSVPEKGHPFQNQKSIYHKTIYSKSGIFIKIFTLYALIFTNNLYEAPLESVVLHGILIIKFTV